MIQNFGEGLGIEEIKPSNADFLIGVVGSLVVDLGSVSVNIRDYGFAQPVAIFSSRYQKPTCFGLEIRLFPQHQRCPGCWVDICWRRRTLCELCMMPTTMKRMLFQAMGQ